MWLNISFYQEGPVSTFAPTIYLYAPFYLFTNIEGIHPHCTFLDILSHHKYVYLTWNSEKGQKCT